RRCSWKCRLEFSGIVPLTPERLFSEAGHHFLWYALTILPVRWPRKYGQQPAAAAFTCGGRGGERRDYRGGGAAADRYPCADRSPGSGYPSTAVQFQAPS